MSPVVRVLYDMVYFGLEKLGRYYSEYPGFIVDNKDPENLHRVRLIIPGIADVPMDSWAWPKALFAGSTFGAHCIPPEGTMVWVSFRLGDPNHPIWFNGHYSADDTKNWTTKQKRYNNYWFQTPQGNIIELDDDEGIVTITDAHGNKIQTSSSGVSVIPMQGGKIFHGSLDKGDEAGAMGETAQKVLTTHNKSLLGALSSLSDLSTNLSSMCTKMAAAVSPLGAAAFLISETPSIINSANNLISNNKILNKSLTDTAKNDLPKIPSTKVFLDR